ncbi:carboxylesterase family protein [Pseudovirgaria hyperparasitica]|uniref:Carboxylic ester hydrolase n=1 Tax=Pseudovirgaria hyperparasitica TaxID=470096 RepID=A0A6A6WIF8_9PEZI|nr:carboxylesterase family protein [Pseudovirgaria hyperparasitica]KAF2761786.1 carboxylesterase family protein [Pseudovirgaria hyperparasitica]
MVFARLLRNHIALVILTSLTSVSSSTLRLNTTSGILQGFSPYPGVDAFFGIPFAQPPVGDLRFAPPAPFEPKSPDEVLDTTQTPPTCYQISYITSASDKYSGVSEAEDCLTINLWKPSNATGNLPVIAWLYGGGFISGGNSLAPYDARRFVSEQRDIIFASINYRVNIFGFPNTPALTTKNIGLLDQRLALEWLRTNIASFGGDPSRMTLMGHSAGSISAALLSYAHVEDPIVSSLIELSGQPGLIPSDDGSSWEHVANTTGCANTENRLAEVACLRALPPRSLKRAITPNNTPTIAEGVAAGAPVVDNVTVFDPSEIARRGREGAFAKLPLLVTHTTHESDSILPADPVVGVNHTLSDLITLTGQHCPVAAAAGYWAAQGVPTWRYLFDGVFDATRPYDWIRSYHGSDNNLIFSGEQLFAWEEPSKEALEAGRYLRAAIAAFVRDPVNGLERFGWPRYTGEGKTLVRLFSNQTASVEFDDPTDYDAPCAQLQSS